MLVGFTDICDGFPEHRRAVIDQVETMTDMRAGSSL